ncbi:MAG: AI-2E family transporter, partial [Nanoarchaeota archaeon]|nr:AI-2E family transporter [Nanoarchaeota archaeon]
RSQIQNGIKTLTNLIIKKSSDFLLSVPRILLNLFVIIFTLFYFLIDGKTFLKEMGVYLHLGKKRYDHILTRLKEIVRGVVFGYLLVALIQGALGAIGFFLFGISSPLFWGLVMAFMALIPILGTGIIWLPASVYLFLEGMFQNSNSLMLKGVGLFVYSLILVSSLDNLIRPRLMGGKAKIHPAVILLGTLGGLFMFGPLGVILGPLSLSLLVVLAKSYRRNIY